MLPRFKIKRLSCLCNMSSYLVYLLGLKIPYSVSASIRHDGVITDYVSMRRKVHRAFTLEIKHCPLNADLIK